MHAVQCKARSAKFAMQTDFDYHHRELIEPAGSLPFKRSKLWQQIAVAFNYKLM